MALTFRNLSIDPAAPVSSWPTEAVQTALERGDLDDWRRIVTALKQEPWGRVARQLEEVLSHSRPYGVAEAFETVLAGIRADVDAGERAEVATAVRAAIAQSGLSRSEFASRIGTSTSRLSTYATGRVTPSAAIMVRIRRLVERERAGEL